MTPGAAVMVLSAAVASAALTWAWIAFARRQLIQDEPGRRRLHNSPTPRGGGIAIAVVLLAGLGWAGANTVGGGQLLGLAAGIALFAGIGLADDLLSISALAKFLLQILAGTALVLALSQTWNLGWLALAGLVLACCYVVNIWNFMDGSNGLITVQALLIALAIGFWPGQAEPMLFAAMALAGACVGFLPFNLPRARVFLGDVGSHALGAAVFGLLLLAWQQGSISLGQSLLMGTVLLLDSGYTLLRRLLAGRIIWQAHRDHLYQYAVRRGHSHARVCLFYAASTLLALALARMFNEFRSGLVMLVLLIFSWATATAVYFGLRRRWLRPKHRGAIHD